MDIYYNPKIDYLFAKYLYSKPVIIEDEQEWKDVYDRIVEPSTIEQRIMMYSKEIIAFVKDESTKFTVENIFKCFQILTQEEEKACKIRNLAALENVVRSFETRSEEDIAGEMFIYVLKEKIFPRKYNVEMSKIIHNFIQWKTNRIPAIIYRFQMKKIEHLLKDKEYDGALLEMNNIYQRTSHYNQKHTVIPFSIIKSKILSLKEKLHKKYGVYEMYVYGSYAKGTANEYSDLDVYLRVDKSFIDDDIRCDVFFYLEKELGIEVDGKLVAINTIREGLKADMSRHLIKIY